MKPVRKIVNSVGKSTMKTFNNVMANIGLYHSLGLKIIVIISYIAVFFVCFLHQCNETYDDFHVLKKSICESLLTKIEKHLLSVFDTMFITSNMEIIEKDMDYEWIRYKEAIDTSKQDNLNINKETEEEHTTYKIIYKESPVTTFLLVVITVLLVIKFFGKKIMRRCSQNKKTGKRDRLKNKDEMLIQNNFVYLIEQIEPLDIIDYLFQQNVLTLDDMDLIKNASITRSKRAENLLFVLLKSGSSSALEVFMKSLENQYAYVLSHMKENHSNIEMTLSAVETAVGNRQEDSQV